MSSIGFPGIFILMLPIAVYGFIIYCLWKFYRLVSNINDNIAGIRQAIERNGRTESDVPV